MLGISKIAVTLALAELAAAATLVQVNGQSFVNKVSTRLALYSMIG
jgi:hypothetical protein